MGAGGQVRRQRGMLLAMLAFLRENKRYWVPPILVFLAVLAYLAWRASQTPDSPFEYLPY